MSSKYARKFFLKEENYCSIELPSYFKFQNILDRINNELQRLDDQGKDPKPYDVAKLRNCERVNHIVFTHKEKKLSWRPLQLIHPLLYVKLAREITTTENWGKIKKLFNKFPGNERIVCTSIPSESTRRHSDRAEQILQWWSNFEQEIISLSLEYKYSYNTDIADCYSSIYTHSIAWAVEGRDIAKKERDKKHLLGNRIDRQISDMQNAQTNGIPQGSVLMDFIAEIVLKYIDKLLCEEIKNRGIESYKILRYRDNYKVFVNSQKDGELILRALAEVLIPFGMKLNSSKTIQNKTVISGAIKPDKLAWMQLNHTNLNIQQELLTILLHSANFPNSGSVVRGLTDLCKRIDGKKITNAIQLISIAVDIMAKNPRSIPICCSIISKLLKYLDQKKTRDRVEKAISSRLIDSPRSEFSQIWLQRMLKNRMLTENISEKLCQLVKNEKAEIWASDWITNKQLLQIMSNEKIFDIDKFNKIDDEIDIHEVDLFFTPYT